VFVLFGRGCLALELNSEAKGAGGELATCGTVGVGVGVGVIDLFVDRASPTSDGIGIGASSGTEDSSNVALGVAVTVG
jgi:hypothetical protein